MKKIIEIVMILLFAVVSWAQNRYVSKTGNDSNSGTDNTHAWLTIGHAAGLAQPGWTVHVAAGTYSERLTLTASGTSGSRIVYISDTKYGAKITGDGTISPAIRFTTASYVDINGFEITNTTGTQGIEIDTAFVRILNNHIHNVAGGCQLGLLTTGGAGVNIFSTPASGNGHDVDVIGNNIHDIGDPLNPHGCWQTHGIYIENQAIGSSYSTKIQNNLVYRVEAIGIQAFHCDPKRMIISNNDVFESGVAGILVASTDGCTNSSTTVDNNIVRHNGLHANCTYLPGTPSQCSSGSTALVGQGGIYEDGLVDSTNVFNNNMLYQNNRSGSTDDTIFLLFGGGTQSGTVSVDPLFVNYTGDNTGDYRLQATSTAINGGVTSCASGVSNCVPTTDFDGVARPQVDIGAYGFTHATTGNVVVRVGGVNSNGVTYTVTSVLWGGLISPSRAIDWTASGIPGGIPPRLTICTTLGTAAQDPTFAQSTTAANINTALSGCASGQTVLLNPGTYTINGQINVPSNVTLRGSGTQQTVLSATGASSSAVIAMGTYGDTPTAGSSTNINSGATQNSTSIVVASATGISVGKYLIISELNDPAYVTITTPNGTCTWCDNSMWSSTRVRGQIVEVTNVAGTTITISPGLYSNYGTATGTGPALATPFTAEANHAGVEDLQIYANNSGYTANVAMTMCAYCWEARVESNYADGDHVQMSFAYRNEVRDSYFTSGYSHTSGSTDDCIFFGGKSSANLVENNILERLHSSVILNWGAAGNVIGYNYSIGSFDSGATDAVMIDFDVHGAHPQFNLWEGNVTPHIFPDSFWGSGAFNTAYRNHVRGTTTVAPFSDASYSGRKTINWGSSHLASQQTRGISIAFPHTSYNLVGNISGSADAFTVAGGAGFNSGTSPYTSSRIAPGTRNYSGTFYAFDIGYDTGSDSTGSGVPTSPINWVGLANSTLFAHGNWDMASTTTVWNAAQANHTLPASFYLLAKPSWFGSLTYPAIGPDVASGTVDTSRLAGHVYPIPAKACYDATTKDADGLLLFDPAVCY